MSKVTSGLFEEALTPISYAVSVLKRWKERDRKELGAVRLYVGQKGGDREGFWKVTVNGKVEDGELFDTWKLYCAFVWNVSDGKWVVTIEQPAID